MGKQKGLVKAQGDRLECVLKKYFEGPKREWWELPPVFLKVANRNIQQRMTRLMGSDPSRLTDRSYIQKLEERLYEVFLEDADERIRKREEAEKARTMQLLLEGFLPLQPGCELENHPIFKTKRKVEEILRERALQEEASKGKRRVARFEYEVFEEDVMMNSVAEFKSISLPSFLSEDSSLHYDMLFEEKEKCNETVTEERQGLYLYQDLEQFKTRRYEYPLVKEIEQCRTVDDMYSLGLRILSQKTAEEKDSRVKVEENEESEGEAGEREEVQENN